MAESGLDWRSLVAFDQVAAGHEGVMSDVSGSLVVKPCVPAEVDFYEISNAEHPEFAQLMPAFMGTLQRGRSEQLERNLVAAASAAAAASNTTGHVPTEAIVLPSALETESSLPAEPAESANPLRGKKLDTEVAVVLENVLAGFKKPNFVDIKLGKRLWADDAPPAKRTKLDDVASKTTSGSLGFRIAGMKLWQPQISGGEYKVFDKFYGRSLTPETVKDAIASLLCLDQHTEDQDMVKDIISNIEDAMGEIERVIANQESRMYSSSLLLVYEGDPQARREAIEAAVAKTTQERESEAQVLQPERDEEEEGEEEDEEDDEEEVEQKLFDVKVIDFAHAMWTPGEGPDENMLFGIRSVRQILKDLRRSGNK